MIILTIIRITNIIKESTDLMKTIAPNDFIDLSLLVTSLKKETNTILNNNPIDEYTSVYSKMLYDSVSSIESCPYSLKSVK